MNMNMNMKISFYHVCTPPFFDEIEQQTKRIVFSTRTGEMHIVDHRSWEQLMSGNWDDLSSDWLESLVQEKLLVPEDENELNALLANNNSAANENTNMSIVIQPTATCQLGCGYCGQSHTPKLLSQEHQDQFIEQIRTKLAGSRYKSLSICWFGAEPLSGMSVIRTLSPRLVSLADEHACDYEASIITNGLLLNDKICTELVAQHHIRSITVSLDGIGEVHDARRHTKAGLPTFDPIFANVIRLAKRDDLNNLEIKIRSNVDSRNCDGIIALLHALAKAGVQKRIRYYAMPIHSWGNDAHMLALSHDEYASQEIKWFCEMINLGFSFGPIPSLKPVVCLAVEPDGLLVDAMGNLFNCTEVSYVPAYGTPNKFNIGHVSRGEYQERRNLLGDFNARVANQEYQCSSCRMLPVCGGACPKEWMEGHVPCPSAKFNIEERLLLAYAQSRLPAVHSTIS